MASRNEKWDRWSYASIAKHLTDTVASPLVIDFGGRRTEAWEDSAHRVEVTIGGLRSRRRNRTLHYVECEVLVTVSSYLTTNNYSHVDVVGDVANALDQCITVKDYGDTGLVDVGILQRKRGGDDFVAPDHIKPKHTDDRLHSTVSGAYEGRFRT